MIARALLRDTAKRVVERVNATGEVYLSHTRVRGLLAIRLAIGHMTTDERHVSRAWELLQRHTDELAAANSA